MAENSNNTRQKRQKTNNSLKAEDYTCFICQEIVGFAVRILSECSCHVIGCHDCVVEYFKTNTKCPHCQKKIKYNKKYHNFSNIELNMLDDCFGKIKCNYCHIQESRVKYINNHVNNCPNMVINCQLCEFVGLNKFHQQYTCMFCKGQDCLQVDHHCEKPEDAQRRDDLFDRANSGLGGCEVCGLAPDNIAHFELTCECGKLSCSEEIREHIKICKKSVVYSYNYSDKKKEVNSLVLSKLIITQKNTIKCKLCNQQYKPLYKYNKYMGWFDELKYHNMTCPVINK